MKKISLLTVVLLVANLLFSQAPQRFSYQAVLRNSDGQVIADKAVKIRLTVLSGSATGTNIYSEDHSVTTNSSGLIAVEAGGGDFVSGSFTNIDWSTGEFWMKVEIDQNLTGTFTEMGTSQLLSVPYALYAESGNPGPQGIQGDIGPVGPRGISINWLGSFTSDPLSPSINQAYYNSVTKKSYVWDGDTWEVITQDGTNGDRGPSGISIQWLGNLDSHPSTPTINQAYYNTVEKKAFIYNGVDWSTITIDGAQGAKGEKGDAGIGLNNKGTWLSTSTYVSGDFVFDRSTLDPAVNSMWICQANVGPSATHPFEDTNNWAEFHAPAGPEGPAGPQGVQGNTGLQGISILWAGSFDTPPTPAINKAYYNITSKKSYIYDGASWNIMTQDGATGLTGATGLNGISIQWAGTFTSHPSAAINKAYYNSIDKKSYIYNGTTWTVISQDGAPGEKGNTGAAGLDGISIYWLGSMASAPPSPTLNQAYYNSTNKISYVYSGSGWSILAQDGTVGPQGPQGAPGTGLINKGNWVSGTSYANGDYVFDRSSTNSAINSMWICQLAISSSTTQPYLDASHWVEFQAPAGPVGPQGPEGPLVTGTSGQTLYHNGTSWTASSSLINDGVNVGVGTVPTQKFDINGDTRLRGNLFDYSNSSGTANNLLTRSTSGVLWKDLPSLGITNGTGSSGQLAIWNGANSLQGLTNLSWTALSNLQVQSIENPGLDDPIFEVKNKDGNVVFGVYQGGVRINVDTTGTAKGARGGFAVGGLTDSKGTLEYFRITPDSARIYVKENPRLKGARGGFAVGGLTDSKAYDSRNMFFVAPDSTRIYVKDNSKGARGGFAVGGLTDSKTLSDKYIDMTRNNYFIGHQSGALTTELGLYNSFLGFQTGMANTDGSYNSFIGYKSGLSNTTGSSNVFIGNESGRSNIQGGNNVFLGFNAGLNNNANSNVFMGYQSGYHNQLGSDNVFLGTQSGYSNILGNYNTLLGYKAGFTNDTSYNSFIGYQAGYSNFKGTYNTMIGYNAGYSNSSGSSNVFIGYESGKSNTTGTNNIYIGNNAGLNSNGDRNISIGYEAGKIASGNDNIFIGLRAGTLMTSGGYNLLIGTDAGAKHTTQQYNVMLGTGAGYSLTWGSFNSFVGINAGNKITSGTNNTFLGTNAGAMLESGNGNTIVGIDAGRGGAWDPPTYHTDYITSYNTFLGNGAGRNIDVGNGNVFLGYMAASGLQGTVETPISNKLYIANSGAAVPLIYGDFSTGLIGLGTINPQYKLDISGDINITGNYRVNGVPIAGGSSQWITSGSNIYFDAGNVGIGASSPTSKLQVQSTTLNQYGHLTVNRSNAGGLGGTMVIRNAVTGTLGNAAALSFELDGTTAYETSGANAGNGEIRATIDGANGSTKLQISNWNGTSGTENIGIVLANNGNVGIGTASPSQRLQVTDGNAIINNTFIGDVGHGITYAAFAHSSSATVPGYALLQSSDGLHTFLNKKSGTGYIGFRIENIDKMVLDNSGNVGIGTTSPAKKLDVNGNANVNGNLTATSVTSNVTGNLSGNVTGDVTGNLTGKVNGFSMNRIFLLGSGSILTTKTGFELYWEQDEDMIIIKNNVSKAPSIRCYYWYQSQSGGATDGGSGEVATGSTAEIYGIFTKGFEIHFGDQDGESVCSIWIQCAEHPTTTKPFITGHYIMY